MHKATSIFFAFIFLAYSTSFSELLKMPVLVHHYLSHINSGRSESLTGFLVEHYLDNHGSDEDSDEDSRLPFKTAENTFSGLQVIPVPFADAVTPPVISREADFNLVHDPEISGTDRGIFHPPRPAC
ncbi:MAG TPA: hypothetical protein VFZ78_09160 [Flavisolibacter sp.]